MHLHEHHTSTTVTSRNTEPIRHPSLGQELLERRLVNDDIPHRPQPLPPRLLLFQQLPAAGDITGVQLGKHVLAEGLDGLAGDDALASGGLDDDLCKQLASHTI
jgi:hypothetical protein